MLNFYRLQQDYLKFEGTDRLDLINRLSTNEVNSLKQFGGTKTILTSDKGRFIDILTLYNFGDFVLAACSLNNSKDVIAHLDKYTIMDDFKPTDMSGTHEAILFHGSDVNLFAAKLFNINSIDFENNNFSVYVEKDRHSIITRNDDAFGGLNFIYAAKDRAYWEEKMFKNDEENRFGLIETTPAEYETKRIEYGIPAFGKEMTELANPLECGLNRYVSFTKGCYIGQEVIARLDAYDKISKHMVGIRSGGEIPIGGKTGEVKLQVDDKECGFVTSGCISGKFGNIGLGFVKTIFLNFDKPYKVIYGGRSVDCRITKLPFENELLAHSCHA